MSRSDMLVFGGIVLVVIGVGLWSVAAALIVAGVTLAAVGALLAWLETRGREQPAGGGA